MSFCTARIRVLREKKEENEGLFKAEAGNVVDCKKRKGQLAFPARGKEKEEED